MLVACGAYLGLRKAELCALRWSDVDLDQKVAHVQNSAEFTTKNGKNRTIPLCDELHAILAEHRRASGFVLKPENPYVPGRRYRWDFRGLLESLVTAAGLDPDEITPHILRHTFASLCAQHRVSLHKIATWMGHSTTEVTELYAHLCAYDPDINLMRGGDAAAASPPLRSPAHLRIVK